MSSVSAATTEIQPALVSKALEGDARAIESLFQALMPLLLHQALSVCLRCGIPRDLHEDFAQDVAAHLLEQDMSRIAEWYEHQRGPFLHYVSAVCSNKLIDIIREYRRRPAEPLGNDGDELPSSPSDDPVLASVLFRDCWLRLPDHYRAVLTQRYFDGLSSHEIADMLGCSYLAVDSLAARARRALANLLTEAGDS
jgi:RNA polymerase sigma-70 factor (ECF subfamily)